MAEPYWKGTTNEQYKRKSDCESRWRMNGLLSIGLACALGLVFFPGAWILVLLIEKWMDSCPNGPSRKESNDRK